MIYYESALLNTIIHTTRVSMSHAFHNLLVFSLFYFHFNLIPLTYVLLNYISSLI